MTTKPPYPVDIGSIWQHSNGTFWQIVSHMDEKLGEDFITAKKLRTGSVFPFHKKEWYRTMTFEAWDLNSFEEKFK